ncbi:MAG TPA: hypothetical protein VMW41_01720 [Candidatus Bathyarchaeia archaeon]|nr:hypothetical protein [Candidatus Bathyarchaeia archaeon]
MKTNAPSVNTNQPSIIPDRPIIQTQNNKFVKVFLYVFGAIFFMAVGALGYGYLQDNRVNTTTSTTNLITQISSPQQEQPTLITKPTLSLTTSNQRVYKNEKYNFKFNYPQDRYFKGELSSSFRLEERDSQIIIINTTHRSDSSTEDFPNVYTIYDANTTDKNNLVDWWQKNMKTEIGGHKIPGDYNTALDVIPFDGCIEEFYEDNWQWPPSLEVTLKEGVEEPGAYIGSIYFYYDFGKPFILNFTEESTGACGNKDSYLVFTSISRLHFN